MLACEHPILAHPILAHPILAKDHAIGIGLDFDGAVQSRLNADHPKNVVLIPRRFTQCDYSGVKARGL